MAVKDMLSRFRSISRPSLSSGANSTYSTLAKKTQAAEDAIIDNQYNAGDLSPEYYLNKLQERAARPTTTPLQKVSLNQKIQDVQVAVNDADVSRRYAAGELTTSDVLSYEKSKLNNMSEPTSAAYIKQQQKVQGLQDKAEKEARNQTRIAENLRISRLPEDTSANLWEKARLYQTLSDQARLDGDTQQADVLLTQANNYQNSAKKADVNDLITGARLSVSETPNAGLGVPSSVNGGDAFSKLAGGLPISGSATATSGGVSQTTPSAVSTTKTGFTVTQTPAVKNALESLDRQQKTIQRLYQQQADNQTMVERYRQAVNAATGDQKTSLQISLNNLIESGKGIQNQIDIQTGNVNDTVSRIQELQAKAALTSFKSEVRTNNTQFDKAESDLETAFKKGQIGKNEYIQKGVQLADTKQQYQSQVADVFGQYGEDLSAETYTQKSVETQKVHEQLTNVANNIDSYEPIAVEPGGKITNLFGKTMIPGEVALTNVQNLKDNGTFQRQYAAKDGKFYKVHFPSDITDQNGDLLPAYVNEDLSKYNDKAFIYQVDQNGKVIGKDNPTSQIKFATINGVQRPFNSDLFKKMADIGSIQKDNSGAWVQTPDPTPNLLARIENVLIKTGVLHQEGDQGWLGKAGDFLSKGINAVTDKILGVKKPDYGNPGQMQSTPQNKTGFKLPSLVSTVSAHEPSSTALTVKVPTQYQGLINDAASKHGLDPNILAALLDQESMHFNQDVINGKIKSPVGAEGIAQFMPATSKQQGVNPYDVKSAIFGAAKYLSGLTKQFGGDIEKGLAAYNAGAGNVQKYNGIPPFKETQNYVKTIMAKATPASGAVKGAMTTSAPVAKDYTSTSSVPDPRRENNIALALGMKPGQYRSDLKDSFKDQAAIDRGFRGDKASQDLLRSEGFKPSWETTSVSGSSQPIASSMPKVQQPAQQSSNNFVQNAYNSVSNAAKQVSSGVSNMVSNIKLPTISLPKLSSTPTNTSKPNIVQQATTAVKSNPVVQSISNAVKNVVSKISSWFK